jgi:hypothetical protein
LFIVDLFCDEYKATIISTTGKTQICPRTFSKKFLSDNSEWKYKIRFCNLFLSVSLPCRLSAQKHYTFAEVL